MLNKELVKQTAKKIDEKIDWVKITGKRIIGRLIEGIDNYVLPWGLDYLNENFGNKIPDKFKDEAEKVLQCFVNDDYNGILNVLPEVTDEFIDIKAFEEDFEALFIATNTQALFKLIVFWAKSKMKEPVG